MHSMMRLLIASTVCAMLTLILLSMCISTQEWTYAPASKVPVRINGSRESIQWRCVFDGSCKLKFWKMESEWLTACYVLMLLALAIQFIGIILGITAMLLTKCRRVSVYLFSAAQILVSVILVFVFIIHGIEYSRNSKEHGVKAGRHTYVLKEESITQGYWYWVLFADTALSVVTTVIISTVAKRIRQNYGHI